MTLRRADRVFSRQAPGFLVLGDNEGALTEVSGSGAEVWECLDQPIEQTTIVQRLAARHCVDADAIAADIDSLISGLIERGLVICDD